MDPAAAMGGAPMDPALQAAAPDAAMQQMVQQAVQQAVGQQGTGASPGAAGVAGKPAKPDVAAELAKANEQIYKIGIGITLLFNHLGIELPPSMMFGAPPATLDPALQQAAVTPGGGMPGADAGGGGMPGGMGLPGAEAAQAKAAADAADAFAKFADEFELGFDDAAPAGGEELMTAVSPPDSVGTPYGTSAPAIEASPLSLAGMLRKRARGY